MSNRSSLEGAAKRRFDRTGSRGTVTTMTPAPHLHPDVAHLASLLGRWVGHGDGQYPTIEPFAYTEELEFGHLGKPFLTMTQRSRSADDDRPLHTETGYLRPAGEPGLELVVAHPMGHVELSLGQVTVTSSGLEVHLTSAAVTATPTAKEVTALHRRLVLEFGGSTGPDSLTTTLHMAAVGQPLLPHLRSILRRVTP